MILETAGISKPYTLLSRADLARACITPSLNLRVLPLDARIQATRSPSPRRCGTAPLPSGTLGPRYADALRYQFGKTLGDAQQGLKTLNRATEGRFERTLATHPKLVEELQAGLAAKLNAIPALPADVNPKLARPGFERGFRAGLLDAKLAAVVVDFATNVALALSGDLAILAEQAGATALRGAIARFKSLPVFLPATIGAGGGFVRLPQAATAAGVAAEAEGAAAAGKEAAATNAARESAKGFPDRPLPRDKHGNPVPDTDAAHTQLGRKEGTNGGYPQAREFDAAGKPVRDIDFTDHGRPKQHPNPHQHRYEPNTTGGTPSRSRMAKPL